MPTLYTELDINAPQSVVWDALIRKDQWRFWNTFLYDCDPGLRIARGSEIFLSMQRLEGDEETEFQPVITMVRPPSMLRWVSTIPGLRTEHMFELRENVPGRTHYVHREHFSGILSKVFLPFIRQDERQGLRRMAQQLKMHVENTILGNPPPSDRYYSRQSNQYPPNQYPPQQYPPNQYPPDQRGYRDRSYDNRGYDDRGYSDRSYDDRGYDRPYNNPGNNPDYGRGYDNRNDYPPDYDYRPRRRR